MWSWESWWLAGWDEPAGNTASFTQPAPAIAATGTVRIVGSAAVEQAAPTIALTGTNGSVVMVPVVTPGGGRVRPAWFVTPQTIEPPRQRIVGVGTVTQPAPVIAATGWVGDSLEERWLLGLISDEELLLGPLPDEELWALGVIDDAELLRRAA